jgi:hypothetical protein
MTVRDGERGALRTVAAVAIGPVDRLWRVHRAVRETW